MKVCVYITVILFSLSACKKDKLASERSIFEGKWKWVYSRVSTLNTSVPETVTEYFYASNTHNIYTTEFDSKGKMTFQLNEQSKTYRVVVDQFYEQNNAYRYEIWPNNKEDNRIFGYISDDTLIISAISYDPRFIPFKGALNKFNHPPLNYYVKVK